MRDKQICLQRELGYRVYLVGSGGGKGGTGEVGEKREKPKLKDREKGGAEQACGLERRRGGGEQDLSLKGYP